MKTTSLFPHRFQPLLTTAAVYASAGIILRLVLWSAFGRIAGSGWQGLVIALPLGVVNDAVVLVYMLFPVTLLLALTPQQILASRCWRWLSVAGFSAMVFGILYLACAEYFFFEEFNARFNLVAVDYLIYPHEVFINIWESYHVLRFLMACGLTTAIIVYLRRASLLKNRVRPEEAPGKRLRFAGLHLAALALFVSTLSTTSLAVTGNRVSNEIIANGISSLFCALHTNGLDYDAFYPILPDKQAFGLMRNELRQRGGALFTKEPRDLSRRFDAGPGLGKRNVVVIVEESFGAQFVGAYGNSEGLTPNFDRLADQGLRFANAFASGTRTVRGLEAIVTSLPPIPSEAIIKRPGNSPIANWGEVMRRQGYETSFLYGGYGLFDNMNPFFGGNGFTTIDRNNIKRVTFSNIWGVCDQDLFRQALDYFDAQHASHAPFFSVIMTTSNHSPYTFPAGIAGVRTKGDRPDGIRYADFALGEFMDKAATHSWYQNTVFVIVADHDARVYGKEQIPLRHYRIPLLVLAPNGVRPQVVSTPTSQIDIAPTVLGLLGLAYEAPFYGQDVLHLPPGQPRPILVNHNHDVGLLLGDRLAVLGLGQETRCYRVNADDSLTAIGKDSRLTELATAYFQTAFELFQGRSYQLTPPESPRNNQFATMTIH